MKKVCALLIVLVVSFCGLVYSQSAFEQRLIEKFKPPAELTAGLDRLFIQNDLTGGVSRLQKCLDDFFVSRGEVHRPQVGDEKQLAGSTKIKIIGCGEVVTVIALVGSNIDENFVLKIPHHIPHDKGLAPWFFYCATRENVSRVLKAAKLRSFIDEHHIQKIKVAKKYLYHIPGAPKELNDTNYLVVAEKFDLISLSEKSLVFTKATRSQIFDLFKIIMAVGYRDFNDGNIALSKNADIVFVDTDEMEVFLFEDGAEFKREGFNELAFLAAQKLIQMFEDLPQLKEVFENNKSLGIKEALRAWPDLSFDDSFRLIKFLKKLCFLGAIKNDVNYFPAANKREILRYAYAQWLQWVCADFDLNENDHALLRDGEACYC